MELHNDLVSGRGLLLSWARSEEDDFRLCFRIRGHHVTMAGAVRVVVVSDEALFMHSPVAAQRNTSGPSVKMEICSGLRLRETQCMFSLCVKRMIPVGPAGALRLRVMALRTDTVSKVGFIFCLCPKVLLVPAASLSHLRVLWHVCKWVRANNVPARTKSYYLSSYWSLIAP